MAAYTQTELRRLVATIARRYKNIAGKFTKPQWEGAFQGAKSFCDLADNSVPPQSYQAYLPAVFRNTGQVPGTNPAVTYGQVRAGVLSIVTGEISGVYEIENL